MSEMEPVKRTQIKKKTCKLEKNGLMGHGLQN